jgi:hypothetical protein
MHRTDEQACSGDRQAVLSCVEDASAVPPTRAMDYAAGRWGKLAVHAECPTATGCKIGSLGRDLPYPICDYRGVAVGARCGKGYEDLRVCSPDGGSILKCDPDAHTFRAELACGKGTRCIPLGPPGTSNPVVTCD